MTWAAVALALALAAPGRIETLHLRYELESGPYHGTYEEWDARDGFHREITDIPGVFREDSAIEGGRAWTADLSGVSHPLSGDALARLITKAYEGASLFAPARPSQSNALDITPPGGAPLSITFDPATGLPQRKQRHAACGPDETETLSDWKKVASGIEVPGRIQRTQDTLTLQLAETRAVDPPFFDPPAIPRTMHARRVDVRLQTYGFHIFVPVSVNRGKQAWFVLDTGADLSFVSSAEAKQSHLRAKASIGATGSGGTEQAGLVPSVNVRVANVNVPLEVIAIVPDTGLSHLWGRAFEGVLGYDFISHFVIRIDSAAGTLTLYDPDRFRDPGNGSAMPLRFRGNNIVVPVKVSLVDGETRSIDAVIDTGSSGALSFRPRFVEDAHLSTLLGKTLTANGYGLGGKSETSIARIAALQLGGFTLSNPIVELSHAGKGSESGCVVPASIGERVLSRFTIYLDYPHNRLILKPGKHLHDRFEYDMSGIELTASGPRFASIEIGSVRDGSPAALAHLQPGDVLLCVGGRPVSRLRMPDIQERLRRAGRVRLAIRRGARVFDVVLTLQPLI
jgi:PDZ domain-containing protein/aspartyl protease